MDDSVAAYTCVTVAHLDGKLWQIFRHTLHTVDVYVVVAYAMHLGEWNLFYHRFRDWL